MNEDGNSGRGGVMVGGMGGGKECGWDGWE